MAATKTGVKKAGTTTIMVVILNFFTILLAVYFLDMSRTTAYKEARSTTSNIAGALSAAISSKLEKTAFGIRALAKEMEGHLARNDVNREMIGKSIREILTELPLASAIRISDKNGEMIFGIEPGVKASAADRDYFIRLRDNSSLKHVLSEPVIGRISKKWSVFQACRINAPDGSFAGIVLAAIPVENISDHLGSIDLGENGVISLRSPKLALIARHPMPENLEGAFAPATPSPELAAILDAGKKEETYVSRLIADNVERVISYRRIDPDSLHLLVGISTDKILSDYRTRTYGVLILVASMLFMSILAVLKDRGHAAKMAAYDKELVESEALFRSIFTGVHDGILVADISDKRIVMANPAMETSLAFASGEILGKTLADIHPAESLDHVIVVFEKQTRGEERVSPSIPFLRKDGSVVELDVTTSTMVLAGRECLVGVFRDTSAQRSAEAALRQKTEELDRYFETSLDLLCIADNDGCFRRLNPEWTHTLGYDLKDLLGRQLLERVHPDDLASTRAALDTLNNKTPILNFVNRYRCSDGSYKCLEWRCFPTGNQIYAVARDVTARIEAEETLRRSEATLLESQRVSRVGHYTFDITGNRWTTSEVLNDIFGIGESQDRSLDGWLSLVHPEDRERMRTYFTEEVLGKGNRFDVEYRVLRPRDGKTAWVHGVGTLEFAPDSTPVTMFGVIQDITERKLAEAKRLEMEKRLQHSQKLESLGILAGGIAHDFNNLLMAVLGNLDLALLEISPLSGTKALIEQAVIASRRAADLTRQMLAYSGKGRFLVSRFNFGDLVMENVHLFKASIGKNITLVTDIARKLPLIEADPGQIQQVVMNLITNASDAIGARIGSIRLETGTVGYDQEDIQRNLADSSAQPGDFVFLEVTDTGTGMDQDTVKRIFDPFFSTKSLGRGLGMSAVFGIIQSHGGLIFIDSEPDRGTKIRVAFRAINDGAGRDGADGPAAGAGHGGGQKTLKAGAVLLVDDEEMVRDVCKRILEHMGHDTIIARDGLEALAVYESNRDKIDFILMDLSMPRMDGVTAARKLLETYPGVKIVLSSGYDESEALQQFGSVGLHGFIQKPYNFRTLQDLLK